MMLAASLLALGSFAPLAPARADSDAAEQARLKKFNRKGAAPSSTSNANDHGTVVGGGKVTTQTEIVAGQNQQPMLSADSATRMVDFANQYRQIVSQGGFTKVPRGTFKKGATNKAVAVLNQRLFQEGYLRPEATQGEFAAVYTSATEDAVARYQRNLGLSVTGKVDGPTLEALNVPAAVRLRAIEANIPRLQVYEQGLGDRYLVVNVPAQQIETVSNGTVYSRHNAIVGRPARPTPVVMAALSDINFNPYWNAPASIVEKDIIPKLTSGADVLHDMNIKVFKGFGGPEIDPDTVNWRTAIADDYHFRQEPGPANAMATAKINFPSPFGIYLHDTPEKQLFNSGNRFYSSGCVRVEQMPKLLEWVLNGQDGIGSSEIAALAETLERRDVKLATPPQLRVAYLTAWPVGNTVAFRNDIYELDGTGFTVGQPMPVGEMSAEGQRFVLKPVPRQPNAVEDAEAEGFGLFGFRRSSAKRPGGTPLVQRPLFTRDAQPGLTQASTTSTPAKKKPAGLFSTTAAKPQDKKVKSKKGDTPGLFDWAAYRKDQKAGAKPRKVAKKKVAPEKPGKEVASATADGKKKLTPKPKATDKAAAATPADAKTTAGKKPAAAPAKPAATAAKKPDATVKKPAPAATAAACKADASGKMPAGCKGPAKKPPGKETASN